MKGSRPCARCGRDHQYNKKAKAPGVCNDCRTADPWYVRQVHDQLVADNQRKKASDAYLAAREIHSAGGRRKHRQAA